MTIREQYSAQLYEALYAKEIPWRNPPEGEPTNVFTKKAYSGVNLLLLQHASHLHQFKSKFWGTFDQWETQGGLVPVDAAPTEIVVYKPSNRGKMDYRVYRWVVYNLDQISASALDRLRPVVRENVDWDVADDLVVQSGAEINFVLGTYAAYNRAPEDNIVFPLKRQFEEGDGGLEGYYDSLFHELIHWSEPRLHWCPDEKWDETTKYAINELRAEMGAAWTATAMGIPNSDMVLNHNKYLDRWLYAMSKDPGLIFKVSMAASEATDYLLRLAGKSVERHNSVPVEAA